MRTTICLYDGRWDSPSRGASETDDNRADWKARGFNEYK